MSDERHPDQRRSAFSLEWDDAYRAATNLSVWPWSDVVSYVGRYAKPVDEFSRVLELGCGAGANIPFFLARGDNYHAVEGSDTIVEALHLRYPNLKSSIVRGDFTESLPFLEPFDLILDRCSITNNDRAAVTRCLALVHKSLRENGIFIGIDWFTSDDPHAVLGTAVDEYTRREFQGSPLEHLGDIHFVEESDLLEMLAATGFEVKILERRTAEMIVGDFGYSRNMFNFVAVRR